MNTNDEYFKLAEPERHFNEIQAGIRTQAATWMGAAFAAIALLLNTNENPKWLVPPAVLIGVVSFMATLGLLVLWINDQMVYQRLLNSGFIMAMKMEYDNEHIPPVRFLMRYSAKGKSLSGWKTLFYTIPMWCFLAITIAATMLRHGLGDTSAAFDSKTSFIVLVALCFIQFGISGYVQLKEKKLGVKALVDAFDDEKFKAMVKDGDKHQAAIAKLIRRYKSAEEEKPESPTTIETVSISLGD